VGNIEERTDASGRYSSTQSYSYDGLYQLETAGGTYVNKPSGHTSWTDRYSQSFSYDGLGNILTKTSTETRVPSASGRPLNYELNYEYDEQRPHRATKIGELYYSYDANGNVTRESTLPEGQSSAYEAPNLSTIGEVRRADQAFGFINEVESGNENEYIRSFSWDAENRLKSVLTSNGKSVKYLYDADGKRSTKYAGDGSYTEGISGETLYFNEWWTETADSGSFRRAKHIYVGKERIVTRLSNPSTGGNPYEDVNTYYYHPDHLGSAHCITDPQGNPYERIEYTPYGEMWIEIQEDEATASYNYIPFRFTAKEWDEETGLYYYGARYLDPKTSRWMSGDPAGFELLNPMDGEGMPRQGYSIVEATNWYSYVSNNPVKYVDPTGMEKDYTIDYEQYNHQDFQIDYYYDNAKEPITVTFDGETHTVGEDLDFGDSVPFDAEFNVPEGSLLEIKSGSTTFSMAGAGRVNLPMSINRYNAIVSSEAFKRAVRKDRLIGVGETAAGVLLMGGSIWLASTLAPETGGAAAMAPAKGFTMGAGLFAFGLSMALGNNNQSAIDDFLFTATPPEAAFNEFGKLR
jgi:RHS repeat-associated protein